MTTYRIPSRARTTSIETIHSLLSVQEADGAFRRRLINTVLLNYDELPAWRQDNHFILTHYRPISHSFFTSFQSSFQVHNESVNIHCTYIASRSIFLILDQSPSTRLVLRVSKSDHRTPPNSLITPSSTDDADSKT